MNTLADQRASSAFVATLRDEPSTASITAAFTQKANRENTLRVNGLGAAIAAAEEVIRERVKNGSRPDIFETLVATDDASGPALYQPYIPTPVPPRSSSIPPAPSTLTMLPAPAPMPKIAPVVVLDPRAFYHPPPPPSFAPARPRRNAFGAFAIAFVAPLLVVAMIIGGVSYAKGQKAEHGVATATNLTAAPAKVEPAPVVTPVVVAAPRSEEPPMLVVEVKSLKSAPASPRKRR